MVKDTLGTRIGKLRGRASQADVAAALGVSRELVKFWESGDRHIKEEDIVKLAEYFHVSADYLLGLSNDTSRTPSGVDVLHLSESATARLKEQTDDELMDLFNRLVSSVAFWGILNDVLQSKQYTTAPNDQTAEMARTKAETYFREKSGGVSGALLYGDRYKDFLRLQIADVILHLID